MLGSGESSADGDISLSNCIQSPEDQYYDYLDAQGQLNPYQIRQEVEAKFDENGYGVDSAALKTYEQMAAAIRRARAARPRPAGSVLCGACSSRKEEYFHYVIPGTNCDHIAVSDDGKASRFIPEDKRARGGDNAA